MVQTITAETEAALAEAIASMGAPLERWARKVREALPGTRWITREDLDAIVKDGTRQSVVRPQLAKILEHPRTLSASRRLPKGLGGALWLIQGGLKDEVRDRNEVFLEKELLACKNLFETVERNPLTEEQARAVVCFDNRVLLVAAAGSGKTSTLVAKAGYAVYRKLASPDEILMLAFNADAAKELGERIRDRLRRFVPASEAIEAQTFHALGLGIIGAATGRKPGLAPWLDKDNGIEEMSEIITTLCTSDLIFRAKWGLYRFVYADDVRKFGSREEPEDWNRKTGERGFLTRKGDMVKSKEECTIANWSYFNGVNYVYEGEYEHDTADATHRQYRPDFYYPDARLYHEHFALDANGEPPEEFEGYMEGVRWKRALHKEKGTSFFETTSAGLRAGSALEDLARELVSRGVALEPSDDRPIDGQPIPPNRELARVLRVFQVHAKSNRFTMAELRQRLSDRPGLGLHARHLLFLEIYERISEEWDKRLAAGNYVDFEDMLNLAADHTETGRWQSPYRLVLVDEFQDVSRARARLLQALVRGTGRFLCAVGDDWQGINRFAGADIKVMSQFEEIFGEGERRFLSTSFRCPQSLCDLSSAFVLRNPAQIAKKVKTTNERTSAAVVCHAAAEDSGIEPLIGNHLRQLWERLKARDVEAGPQGCVSVFVLGRYWSNQPGSLGEWQREFSPELQITFSTIHGSKGLEADYVCVVGLTQARKGFPSQFEDDPVQQLAMPEVDPFPYAEERRLFYVALTRARRLAMLYTIEPWVSEFLVELQGEPYKVPIRRTESAGTANACPKCGRGLLVRKDGPYGPFWGCSRFPACDGKANEGPAAGSRTRHRSHNSSGPRVDR